MKGILCIAWQIVSFLLFRTRQMRRLKELEKTEPVAAQEEAIAEVRKMFHRCLKGCHVNVTVKGLDNIPKDRPVLYVGNHRGFFDCVVGYTTVPGRVGFVAKKELTKYPFLPDWMLLLNCLFLDRKDMKQSLRTILEAIAKAEKIEATDEDNEAAIADQAKRMGQEAEAFKASLSEGQLAYLRETAGIKKTIDFLKENAVITEKAEEKAEEKKEED